MKSARYTLINTKKIAIKKNNMTWQNVENRKQK